jgi:8-oxo-dGTP diphosphatase
VAIDVVAAAIVQDGRVLAARRVRPYDVAGGWELPGGKVDIGEAPDQAVRREVTEELGCTVEVLRPLHGRTSGKPGYEMTAYLARIVSGEPVPQEHDVIRWLGPEDLSDVRWLPADRPFLAEVEALLLEGERMAGGNVGGAVRIGSTVRRPVGAWTPAVHALLGHLARAGFRETPRVLGADERGREVLTYLPGRVMAQDGLLAAPDALLVDAVRWLRRYHDAVATFRHPGPWRNAARAATADEIICHHDLGTYNVAWESSARGPVVVGVFDWDMAGPGRPVEDIAFAAWSWVPLHNLSLPVGEAARRLVLIASAYAGGFTPDQVLAAVMERMDRAVRVIREGQAAGDPGMLNLAAVGEPDRTERTLASLATRLPEIAAELPG